ncbi:hypothetical protein [Streptomyces sp. NBC_00151]|uniref:hypothetical protein n=1 Tax=Streptomyces sp. NBC_00151 TaxID=2975669 RepID=UPI002DDB2C4D|nr:hypothetical protein [Streptomyces sp. NBC_00151]WRZ44502.1 hypothetical protein OG915_44730 [Streptomyces sp. NBC_00151]
MMMKSVLPRRSAVVAVLSAGALALGVGSASAANALIPVTGVSAGVFNTPHTRGGKVGVPDLRFGDAIVADCWDRGDNIGNHGNVWYHTVSERYTATTGQEIFVTGWTYGAYVDDNKAFHDGAVPEC